MEKEKMLELAEKLKGRARFLPYGELDRKLMVEASEMITVMAENFTVAPPTPKHIRKKQEKVSA